MLSTPPTTGALMYPREPSLRYPRTLAEAFPDSVEAAQCIERHRVSWRWMRPLKQVFTAAAGLAVLAWLLVTTTGVSR
jgi:hypothetical protein